MVTQFGIKRALISVSDKSGIVEFSKKLEAKGVEIISTGGTMKALREAGVHVISITSFTGSPEVMDGRVKTLHPKVHAGILYRRNNPKDIEQLAELESKGIDLVVVNLYPFLQTVARAGVSHDEIIENIDIGGPSLLRAAAKNYTSVTVLVDPDDYSQLLDEMQSNDGEISAEFQEECAAKAFALTADYDRAIADYFANRKDTDSPTSTLNLSYAHTASLRYGENPHQSADLYANRKYAAPSLIRAEILSGKELSYNNYNDLDACLELLLDFSEPFACLLKHANPCGAAIGSSIALAYSLAFESDPLSAYGSIIGLNKEVDLDCAEKLHETPFVECILAPSFSPEALLLLRKKKNRRLLELEEITRGRNPVGKSFRFIRGGLLIQQEDSSLESSDDITIVSKRTPSKEELASLLFAWKVVKHTKSNAIVLANKSATVGIGMGQTSRVDSAFMAVRRAGERASGSVMASDAFFPMADGVEVALEAGITAIIQPGGSKGDATVIEAVDRAGAAMAFTGIRHFKH